MLAELTDWTRDLLISRGALVETGDEGAVRALLPAELAERLSAGDWLSLKFGAEAGADDPAEWLDRLGGLLPGLFVAGGRLRYPREAPAVNAAALLEHELVIQNGVFRDAEDCASFALYVFFTFQYTVESDERSLGALTLAMNASARSLVPQPEILLRALRDEVEDDPAFQIPPALAGLYPAAVRAAEAQVRAHVAGLEETARRRLGRDAERIDSYYRDLLAQIDKRIARRAGDPDAQEKERSRARATELDQAAKLEDLRRKYSLRVRLEPVAALAVRLPVREISVRLARKKQERPRTFHWNPILHLLEPPLCEACLGQAQPLYLCETAVHCLCRDCWSACPRCAKVFCKACQPACHCKRV